MRNALSNRINTSTALQNTVALDVIKAFINPQIHKGMLQAFLAISQTPVLCVNSNCEVLYTITSFNLHSSFISHLTITVTSGLLTTVNYFFWFHVECVVNLLMTQFGALLLGFFTLTLLASALRVGMLLGPVFRENSLLYILFVQNHQTYRDA